MTTNIPEDLLVLLKEAINNNINSENDVISDFLIDVVNNDVKGDGFVGDILFVTLTHKKTEEIQELIIKQEKCKDGKAIEISKRPFENEIYFYKTIWPVFQKFYRDQTGKSLDLVPNCLSTSNIALKRIILENVTSKGFAMHDKSKAFDENHLVTIFETYGLYHGISFALRELDNEQYKRLVDPLGSIWKDSFSDGQISSKLHSKRVKLIFSYFDESTEKPILQKLKNFEENGAQKVHQAMVYDKYEGVIQHGDCWSNNMMFKYDVSINIIWL